ncbi:MAG: deoxyhypusine synthase, deoxyhypusine synthase [archaeon GW2011_AR13]|nr:MAG: deoxyhypusine synthase, deoxyhypusine synthase [archaeon GW2011_AR13]HIG94141.1 deoxyhypusine synthase [Nanoarchaeota archaeon]HIH63930.1 deoxyhypusine synthase [Nanoarchaeota archaeon]HIJ09728.1 deoxyhypusine synthase [Nanoarchaeota archaeon]
MKKSKINNEEIAKKSILKESENVEGKVIEGYDFNNGVNYEKIIDSFSTMGFQASHLSKAIDIVNEMIQVNSKIFLGYTSNMVSSGMREIIRYLVQNKKVDVCVTSGGGFEEDIIKCLGETVLGDFRLSGKDLREKGINRIGNLLVPNNNYILYEEFCMPILEELYQDQLKTGKVYAPYEIIWKFGEKINNKKSICYWAWKNQIPIYCPAVLDGSFGDMVYFFKYKRPDFKVDVAEETKQLNESTFGVDKSGVVILGAGLIKHAILNAHLYRDGADYAVYINNAQEFDGSDAGALPEEAISWGKLKPEAKVVKVYGDATIIFPLLVAKTFAKK